MEPIDERDLEGACANCARVSIEAAPLSRRQFLRRAALLSASGIVLLSNHAWAARTFGEDTSKRRLVVMFLRGAVDGLNVVVPHGESAYYDSRPTIAIGRVGAENGAIDLDGFFGLHPALAPVEPLWRDGTLAFVHACGSPDPTRSHFDAQDYMESGTPGVKTTSDGWLNRTLAALPGSNSPTDALSFGPTLPRIMSGPMPVANIPLGRAAARPMALDRPLVEAAFDRLYAGNDPVSRAYQQGRAARQRLMSELTQDMAQANAGAPSPVGFSDDTDRLANLIKRDASIRLAFLALGGWDTHVNQGAANGQLAGYLKPLAEGLASFAKTLGPAYDETAVLVISEFGRTMHENGNGGTDHGHGNVMWVMGGPVRGKRIYGRWPGLSPSELYQQRDLAVATDFRDPIATVLKSHMQLTDAQIDRIFPHRPTQSGNTSTLIRT